VYIERVRPLLALLVPASCVALAVFLAGCGDEEPSGDAPAPVKPLPAAATLVGSETCKECHEDRHETWLGTAHAYALREPDGDSVRGRFDGVAITTPFFRATPYRQGDGYFIRVEGRDGRPSGDHRVVRVVGRTFEQAYLMAGPKGEWRVLPLCWSIDRNEWDVTHRVLDSLVGGGESFPENHDTRHMVFNNGCGQCHATGYDVGHQVADDRYASSMIEGAVACESCHGPGSVHNAWHRKEYPESLEYEWPARLVHPEDDYNATQVVETCGRCHYMHEWRFAIDDDPRVTHHDIAMSRNRDRPGFLADGRLSGLNYHGSVQSQSECYTKGGMSCLHCHDLHGRREWAMKFRGESDAQCTQCHDGYKYAAKEHTHHKETSCVDCHMPKFFKGVLHFSRDHSIRSPEPELTELYGEKNSPNACSLCHADKTVQWNREWKEKWYGKAPRRLVEDVGLVVRLRRAPDGVPAADLAAAVGRADSKLFFRTSALAVLAKRDGPEVAKGVRAALTSGIADLEQHACEELARRPDRAFADELMKKLDSKVRTIRVEAGYALARLGRRGDTPGMRRAYEDALRMLDRQRQFTMVLERICMLADAVGETEAFLERYKSLLLLANWPAGKWPDQAVELRHRHARDLAERGKHRIALEMYGEVRQFAGEEWPPALYIDTADSLAALGGEGDARTMWRQALAKIPEGDDLRIIATARLKRDPAPLRELAERVEKDPVGGQLLRRIRWSLQQMTDDG
jgi:hypothetical protein